MAIQRNHFQAPDPDECPVSGNSADFVVLADIRPPERIEFARERMLLSRLYLGLIQTMNDDYGSEFAKHSDSATYRTIGIYVFLRTVVCSPVRASTIAHVLKIPPTVLRRLNDMVRLGYVERVGNAYYDRQGQHIGPETKATAAGRYDPDDSYGIVEDSPI
jgi:hypothetical protein